MPYDAHLPPSSPRLRPAPPPYAASSQPPPQPSSSAYAPPRPSVASYANHEGPPLPPPREAASHRMGPREARQPLSLAMTKIHGGLMDQMSWHNFDQYVAKSGGRDSPPRAKYICTFAARMERCSDGVGLTSELKWPIENRHVRFRSGGSPFRAARLLIETLPFVRSSVWSSPDAPRGRWRRCKSILGESAAFASPASGAAGARGCGRQARRLLSRPAALSAVRLRQPGVRYALLRDVSQGLTRMNAKSLTAPFGAKPDSPLND